MTDETSRTKGPDPSGTRRNETSVARVVLAALTKRRPSRSGDQPIYWAIKAVKELGFPVVVALILLLKMPGWVQQATSRTAQAVVADARVREEQHHELLAALQRSGEAFAANTAVLQQLVEEAQELRSASDTVRGMVLGRLRCPSCPACRLSCPSVHVETGGQQVPPVKKNEGKQEQRNTADPTGFIQRRFP